MSGRASTESRRVRGLRDAHVPGESSVSRRGGLFSSIGKQKEAQPSQSNCVRIHLRARFWQESMSAGGVALTANSPG